MTCRTGVTFSPGDSTTTSSLSITMTHRPHKTRSVFPHLTACSSSTMICQTEEEEGSSITKTCRSHETSQCPPTTCSFFTASSSAVTVAHRPHETRSLSLHLMLCITQDMASVPSSLFLFHNHDPPTPQNQVSAVLFNSYFISNHYNHYYPQSPHDHINACSCLVPFYL